MSVTIKIKDLVPELEILLKAGKPVLISGAPGIGKSDVVCQSTKRIGCDLFLFHPVVSDPTDYKGLPGIVNGKAEFLPYGDLRKLLEAEKPTVAFLDDLGQAPQSVQAAVMQLLLAREINGQKISDKVCFVAATNRRKDKAGVTGILEPVKSRFNAIYELMVSAEDWIHWAYRNDMPSELIAFINYRPGSLLEEEFSLDIVNHANPRSVAHLGENLNLGLESFASMAGAVGEGFATEFIGFRRIYKELPNIDLILKNPNEAPLFKDPAQMYALAGAMIEKATEDNVENVIKYAMRVQDDFSIMIVRTLIKHSDEIADVAMETETFQEQWAVKFQDDLSF